jgi:hypothetical protein
LKEDGNNERIGGIDKKEFHWFESFQTPLPFAHESPLASDHSRSNSTHGSLERFAAIHAAYEWKALQFLPSLSIESKRKTLLKRIFPKKNLENEA